MTAAEIKAKWQKDKLEKDAHVEELKAKMTPYKPIELWDRGWRRDAPKRRQERVALHLLQSKPLTPPIHWTGFKLEEMPGKHQSHFKVCVLPSQRVVIQTYILQC